MQVVLGRGGRTGQHCSRHPEVNQQSPPRLEPNNQILATTIDRRHLLALEFPCDLERVEGTGQSRIRDLDALEPPPLEDGRDTGSDGLDLGQLRHPAAP